MLGRALRRSLLAFGLVLLVSGGGAQQPADKPPPQPPPGVTACTNPRPQACYMIYRPVCGTRTDGTRRTYSNDCTACADQSVVNHVSGPC